MVEMVVVVVVVVLAVVVRGKALIPPNRGVVGGSLGGSPWQGAEWGGWRR